MAPATVPKKSSSVRHTRAIQRDRSKRPIVTAPNPVITQRLTDLVYPVTLSQRLRVFPAALFRGVVLSLVPTLPARAQARQRPSAPELAWAQHHFAVILAADGSTLDALVREVGLLKDLPDTPLGGTDHRAA